MELVHNEIPVDFLRHMPEGVKLVNRHGHEFLVVEDLRSPAGTRLMSDSVRIHGEPSIRLGVRIGDTSGLIFLDAYWGSHAKLYSFMPSGEFSGKLVEAYVPETGESLMADYTCNVEGCTCDKGIEFRLPGKGNTVRVCGRLGCPGHRLVLGDLAKPIVDTISGINFFGAGSLDEDWFDHPNG